MGFIFFYLFLKANILNRYNAIPPSTAHQIIRATQGANPTEMCSLILKEEGRFGDIEHFNFSIWEAGTYFGCVLHEGDGADIVVGVFGVVDFGYLGEAARSDE